MSRGLLHPGALTRQMWGELNAEDWTETRGRVSCDSFLFAPLYQHHFGGDWAFSSPQLLRSMHPLSHILPGVCRNASRPYLFSHMVSILSHWPLCIWCLFYYPVTHLPVRQSCLSTDFICSLRLHSLASRMLYQIVRHCEKACIAYCLQRGPLWKNQNLWLRESKSKGRTAINRTSFVKGNETEAFEPCLNFEMARAGASWKYSLQKARS